MDRGFNGNVGTDGMGCEGRGLHSVLHVDVVVRRRDRAHLHLHAGAQSVEDVRAAGGEAPEGRPAQGRHRALLLEELPVQPPRQGGARGPAGIPVPAGERRRHVARGPGGHRAPLDSARVGAHRVGLLGTVVGVITAFQGIAASGSGGIGAVSAGIAEALVETALGLVVAIPAVWFYNYLTGRIEYFNVEMDNSSSELVDYFVKKTA